MSFFKLENTEPAKYTYAGGNKSHTYTFEYGILSYVVVFYNTGKTTKDGGKHYNINFGISRIDDASNEYEYNVLVSTNDHIKFFRTIKEILIDFTERMDGIETIRYNLEHLKNNHSGLSGKRVKKLIRKFVTNWGYTEVVSKSDYHFILRS